MNELFITLFIIVTLLVILFLLFFVAIVRAIISKTDSCDDYHVHNYYDDLED